jgi:hypothetical protein
LGKKGLWNCCHSSEIRTIVGALTGHMGINYMLFKLRLSDTPICRFCGSQEETSIHILCVCMALDSARRKNFSAERIRQVDIRRLHFRRILSFMKDVGLAAN